MGTTIGSIPENWIEWIEENRALGIEDEALIRILVENGFDRQTASDEVRHPAVNLQTPERVRQRLQTLETLLSVYSDLYSHRGGRVPEVERRPGVSAAEFFRSYYAVNRPLVLVDQFRACPSLKNWNPDYLGARCGNEMVEVMTGRSSDREYEINSNRHKTRMKMGDFVARVKAAGETNDFYMVANNRTLEARNMQTLLNEVHLLDDILDPSQTGGRMFLWFGPGGTVTPMHHDTSNILLAQVFGRKMVTLVPSFQTPLVYNHIGVYSQVDCEKPDYRRFPLFRKATMLKVLLEPGQILFIPVGWWHHVRSLDVSISLSFTNFKAPNSYGWD